jgi:hypothetical protein
VGLGNVIVVTTLGSAVKRLQGRAKTDVKLTKAMKAVFEAIS